MAIEIVSFPINSMVNFHITLCEQFTRGYYHGKKMVGKWSNGEFYIMVVPPKLQDGLFPWNSH